MDINNSVDVDFIKLNSQNLENLNVKNAEDKKLREVANEFESFFLQQIMDVSLKSTNIAGEAPGSDIIKGMYTQTLSRETAGSAGISDMLYNFLIENR